MTNGLPDPPQDPVASPCVGVCVFDPVGKVCRGCLRTLAEIAAWMSLPETAKREVLARVAERRRGSLGQ